MRTSILLVDDHPIFIKGLRSLLDDETDMMVVGEANDGQTALELIQKHTPDLVVMDISMPGLTGIQATKQIASNFPGIKVIALSIHSEKEFVEGMIQAGAAGYIIKETVVEELVKGIRTVIQGGAYISPSLTGILMSGFRESLSLDLDPPPKDIELTISKMIQPPVMDIHVDRPHLVEWLEKNRHLSVQAVIAPAGYGKSTLTSHWFSVLDWPKAWISLDREDNDLERFLLYLNHSITTLFPKAMATTRVMLATAVLPPIHRLAEAIDNDLNRIEQDFILVLDDFHFIKNKNINDLIAQLLRHPPQYLHLVLLSRSDPFLPVAQLRAKGQSAELRMNDLQFTRTETAEYLTRMTGKKPDKNEIDKWLYRTEGWITGLRLSALSKKQETDFNTIYHGLKGQSKYVMEYFFYEVFSSQPEKICDYLLQTAIVDRFCAPLCNALSGKTDSWEFISHVKNKNLFIITLDEDKQWFRYHHLFKNFLQNRLKRQRSHEQILELHKRAFEWFSNENLVDESIQHKLEVGDTLSAVRIIEANRQTCLDAGKWNTLKTWLAKLPHNLIQERPELLLTKAWIQFMSARLMDIKPMIKQVESLLVQESKKPHLLAEIAFFRGVIWYFQGKGDHSLECFSQAAQWINEKGFPSLQSEIECWGCLALHLKGQNETAIKQLNDQISGQDIQEEIRLSRLTFGLCFIHMLDGDWLAALHNGLQLEEICRSTRLVFAAAWAMYVQGNASFQMFDLETAYHRFRLVLKHRYMKNHRVAVDAMGGLAITCQFMGKPDEADEAIETAKDYAQWANIPELFEIVRSCQARLALLRGDLNSASNWQRGLHGTPAHPAMLFFLENPVLTECRVLIAIGSEKNLERAIEKISDLKQKFKSWNNTCQKIEITVLHALAVFYQGKGDAAVSILAETVTLAEKGGWVRPFVELGSPMKDMLNLLQEKKLAKGGIDLLLKALTDYESKVVRAKEESPDPGFSHSSLLITQSLVDPLTDRETEILELLGQHLYNKEIADKLFISSETVKTHLKNVYGKLDVPNRRLAVSKGIELGILRNGS
jgi:LuxR family maltose regulon positive regulatory protein